MMRLCRCNVVGETDCRLSCSAHVVDVVELFDAFFLTRKSLQRSGKYFIILKILPSCVYQYRFVIDGQWRYSPDVSWTKDEAGNTYNILDCSSHKADDDIGLKIIAKAMLRAFGDESSSNPSSSLTGSEEKEKEDKREEQLDDWSTSSCGRYFESS
ncbi:hypothetical protein E3N88_26928 [Mikania micrantha]|uniref:AMP-activated protein kinase glycogen-binding domain-containing protein n=1 Tax=Mikania micrantha TaxID=192012 RepID=A0A5N6MW90_9ASTR|nr:hypothetical protein E3N88_26928 [Mikania micrantha]